MSTRVDRLVELVGERELDCLLVTEPVAVRYLTGFTGSNGACLITAAGERMFITDFRYTEQAADQVDGFDLLPAGRELAIDLAPRLTGRAGFDDAHTSVREHGRLTGELRDGVELVPAGGLVESLRLVKEPGELERIAASQELATAALERTLSRGLAGRTERAVALDLENEMRAAGASGASFDSIVAAGPHGALPHAEPRDEPIPRDALVVVDWGAQLDGYCSDCTRTLATGEHVAQAHLDVYAVVLDAQRRAVSAVRAGAECRELDAIAREAITVAGHGEHFGHGLGHGVGLEIHEEPRLSKTGKGELAPGTVVTVEPGVYLPGEVGVRIEDLVVVTDAGSDVLTTFPKELTVVD